MGLMLPGPYLINDVTLLNSLVGQDAVIPDADQKAGRGIQCVGLVKFYSASGAAADWTGGDFVMDRQTIVPGTAIATFNAQNRYSNASSGNHACFFISFMPDRKGIRVLEQHVKPFPSKIQQRNILSRGRICIDKNSDASNNADAYSIVL